MKKLISVIMSLIIALTCFAPLTAFAADSTDNEVYLTQQEAEEIVYAEYSKERATGLILGRDLWISKSGTTLNIVGYTTGSSEVVKCGFTKVKVQRKKADATFWSNYITYDDLYSESKRYDLRKSPTVESGYQYRVTATHYAKKSLLSTQKIDATTGYIAF